MIRFLQKVQVGLDLEILADDVRAVTTGEYDIIASLPDSLPSRALRWVRIPTAPALASPVFGNLLRGLVQPVLVNRKTNHLDCREPFRCVRGRIAQRRQLAHGHQNLNVVLREAQ